MIKLETPEERGSACPQPREAPEEPGLGFPGQVDGTWDQSTAGHLSFHQVGIPTNHVSPVDASPKAKPRAPSSPRLDPQVDSTVISYWIPSPLVFPALAILHPALGALWQL